MKTPLVAAATALTITAATVVAFVAPSESAPRGQRPTASLSALQARVGALERRVSRMDDRLNALENGSSGPGTPGKPGDPPTGVPTDVPTDLPTDVPTDVPTTVPTGEPTSAPPTSPTTGPTSAPPSSPTTTPSSPTTSPSSPSTTPDPAPSGDFPSASTTGPRAAITETRGSITINQDGTVLENMVITGQVTVNADNVLIRNVDVRPGGANYGILVWGSGAQITDTAVHGSGNTLGGIVAYEQGSFDALRVDVSGTEDGVRMADNCTLVDSYVHDLQGSSSSHYDAVTADGYRGWRIEHNTILNDHSQTSVVWIDDPRYRASSGVLNDNYLAGGGYTIYSGPGTSPGLKVTNNVFSKRYYSRSGYWGPVTGWTGSGNTWSGNVYEGGGSVNP